MPICIEKEIQEVIASREVTCNEVTELWNRGSPKITIPSESTRYQNIWVCTLCFETPCQ